MSSLPPKRVRGVTGRVSKGKFGAGSKSEREAVFITVEGVRWLLRRKAGPVYADPELERYVGHSVVCDGFLVDSTLLAERIEQID